MACVVILAPIYSERVRPDFSLERRVPVLRFARKATSCLDSPQPVAPALPLAGAAVFAAPVSFGEEFGWRGYLQLRLFPNNPVLSAVGTGVIWGMWHFPAAIRGYTYPHNPIIGALIMYPLFGIVLSIIYGWLVQKTGSIWSSSLAHAANNAVGGQLSMLLFGGAANVLFASIEGLLGLIPLAALSAWIVFTGQLKPAVQASNESARTAQAS